MQLPRPTRRRSSVLLTSLVDVLFVLLFFFMLTSGAIGRRSIAIGTPAEAPSPMRLDGAADARAFLLLLPGRRVAIDAAPFELAASVDELRRRGVRAVTVAAGEGVPLQDLVDLVDRLQAASIALVLAGSPAP